MTRMWLVAAVIGLAGAGAAACGGSSNKDQSATQLGKTVIAAVTQATPTAAEDTPGAETPLGETPPSAHGQLAELTAAAKGTWSGEYGTLTFNTDGTAKFSIKNCGVSEVFGNGRPFGVLSNCDPTDMTGKLEVREHEYAVRDDTGAATILQAYVDGDGNLHVGSGTLDELDPSGKGAINIYARGTLIVGDTCTYKDPSSAGTSTATCSFSTKEGQRVLSWEIAPSHAGDSPDHGELVHLPDLGLIVEPAIYLGKFTKQQAAVP